jgi:hypothetical protein
MDEADPRLEFKVVWVFEEIAPSRLTESGGLFQVHVVFPSKVP